MKRLKWGFAENPDLLLAIVIAVAAAAFMRTMNHQKPDAAIIYATLAGALFGAVALLLGNWINRRYDHAKARREIHDRKRKFTTIVNAELVDVSAGLLGAAGLLTAAARQASLQGGGTIDLDMRMYMPREMPLTFGTAEDLTVFEQPAIDALVTLRSSLDITAQEFARVSQQNVGAWTLDVIRLCHGVAHTMGVLAQCFERVAPNTKLLLAYNDPGPGDLLPASARIRQTAGELLQVAPWR